MEIVFAAFCISFYFVHITPIPSYIKRKTGYKRIKPFDCATCLSVYVSALLYFLPYQYTHFISIIFGTGMLTAVLANYLLNKHL